MDLSIPQAVLISGHKDVKMLMRYTHLRAENLVQKFDQQITRAKSDFSFTATPLGAPRVLYLGVPGLLVIRLWAGGSGLQNNDL